MKKKGELIGRVVLAYIDSTICKTASRKLLCNAGTEAWCSGMTEAGGMGRRGGARERWSICTQVADSHCCPAETNTACKAIIFQFKKNIKRSIAQFCLLVFLGPFHNFCYFSPV